MISIRGFTLVELMIVIAIIGVLVGVTLPTHQNYTVRAQVSETLNMASALKSEVIAKYGESGACPITPEDLGLNTSGTVNTKYIQSVGITTYTGAVCAFQFTFNSNRMNAGVAGKTLTFAMMNYTGNGAASWECASSQIRQIYLPTICKGI